MPQGSTLRYLFLTLALLPARARFLLNETIPTSTCSGSFNAPCAVGKVNRLVDALSQALEAASTSAAVASIFSEVNLGNGTYSPDTNFWCNVYNSTGGIVASGRPPLDGNPDLCPGASCIVGHNMEDVAAAETGLLQTGLWSRVVAAAESGDGYYTFSGFDNHNQRAHTYDAVTRIGFVRNVTTSIGVLYVASAFSDVPLADTWGKRVCSPAYDSLCSIAYARKVLGTTMTRLLRADNEAALQEALHAATWRDFNEQTNNGATVGFYPFVFSFDPATIETAAGGGGTCVAHGANAAFVGKTLSEMVVQTNVGDAAVGKNLGQSFAEAALDGGGYVSYLWGDAQTLKISFVVGIVRFGVVYYLGVGFNHYEKMRAQGPGCAVCEMKFNYPCAWENALSLVGHAQALLFMGKGTEAVTTQTAFARLTTEASYGADQSLVANGLSTAGLLYAFAFSYSTGNCTAHGAKSANVGRHHVDIGLPTAYHEQFMAKADAGGGWVHYDWRNSASEPWYKKASYVIKIVRDGEEYYVGAGLSQLPYDGVGDCSLNWRSPCAEAWAHRVAGERITQIYKATDNADLLTALSSGRDLPSPESPFGFASHVHTSVFAHGTQSEVLADGHWSAAVGKTTSEWLRHAGISSNDLEAAQASEGGFTWLGPFMQFSPDPTSPPAPYYLFYVPLPIEDRLSADAGNGVGDEYAVIVPVSAGTPSPTRLSDSGSCSVRCMDYEEHQSQCSAKTGARICTPANNPLDMQSLSAECTKNFVDDGNNVGNTQYGISAWLDTESSVPFCGCDDAHELLFVPVSGVNVVTSTCDVSECEGTAESCANIREMHEQYWQSCGRTAPYQPIVEITIGTIGGTLALALCCFYFYRTNAQKKMKALRQELADFRDSVVGMRAVSRDYDPRDGQAATLLASDEGSSKEKMCAAIKHELGIEGGQEEVLVQAAGMLGLDPTGADLMNRIAVLVFGQAAAVPNQAGVEAGASKETVAAARWYWQEDEAMVGKHNPADVLQPGNWVKYSQSVCRELDVAFASQNASGTIRIDLTDRIGSTGTEQKAQKNETGVVFDANFDRMEQKNVKSGFVRKMNRVEIAPAQTLPNSVNMSTKAERRTAPPGVTRTSTNDLRRSRPKETLAEDGLLMRMDQIIQVSKHRPDGWAFGNVVWDPFADRPPLGVDGVSTVAGWFPMEATEAPTTEQLKELQKSMSAGGADAMKQPKTWTQLKDPMQAEAVRVHGEERDAVVRAFMKTLSPVIQVVDVERVQNLSMWQSYAVKRTSILSREIDDTQTNIKSVTDSAAVARLEKKWLFHGTDEATVPKIMQQGFNRSYAGRNMCRFGKGVYFARDASYSSSPTYSKPNSSKVQHMFACRVVVGEYCLGKNDALAPDARKGHQLYDSTVNDVASPGIYVTYHDAQAYPEYLIKFKQ